MDKSEAVTPRRDRAPVAVQKNSPYENLQDGPTPSGRLGDRIRQLRQQCINALGKEPFASAYDFLRQNQVVNYCSHLITSYHIELVVTGFG